MVKGTMKMNSIRKGNNSSFMEIIANILVAMLPIGYIVKGGYQGTVFTDFTAIIFYSAIFFIIAMLTVGKTKFVLIRFDFLMLIFAFWILLGVFYSPFKELGIIKFVRFLFFSVSIIYIVRILVKKSEQIDRIIYIYSIIITLISISFIASYYKMGLYGRSSYMNTSAVAFGYSIGFGILYIVNKLFIVEGKLTLYKSLLIIFLVINLYALALNATKGALASILIVLFSFIAFYYKKNKKLFFYIALLAFFFVFLGMHLIVNIGMYANVPILQRIFYINKDLSTIYRFELWKQAVQDFLKSPIWGIGTAGFAATIGGSFQIGIYPHSIILEIGAENGAIGVLLLCFIIYYIIKVYKKTKKSYQSILLMQLVTFSLIGNMFSFSYSINKLFYFSTGLLIINILLERRKNQNEKSSFTN